MKEVRIYCPTCGRYIFSATDKTTMVLEMKCRKCNLLVVYDGRNGKVKNSYIPKRKTSSGKRFF